MIQIMIMINSDYIAGSFLYRTIFVRDQPGVHWISRVPQACIANGAYDIRRFVRGRVINND
jgi:hypothetical protein